MRRFLLAALVLALLIGAFAGVASARFAEEPASSAPALAPFDDRAAMPTADPAQPGAYGFRSSDEIAAALSAGTPGAAAASETTTGASASVTVTATVLPVLIIVVDDEGSVTELFTNTTDRGAGDVLYTVRRDDVSGEPAELTEDIWAETRAAMAQAAAGSSSIWTA